MRSPLGKLDVPAGAVGVATPHDVCARMRCGSLAARAPPGGPARVCPSLPHHNQLLPLSHQQLMGGEGFIYPALAHTKRHLLQTGRYWCELL